MIGSYVAEDMSGPLLRAFHRCLGVPDFHTHVRSHWISRYANVGPASFCELGCGMGLNLIELLLRAPRATAIGYETQGSEVENGRRTLARLGLSDRLRLQRVDLTQTLPAEVGTADYVLLIDVLEHLPDPAGAAARIVTTMKPGATLLVSVPTVLYPKVFGRRFHVEVGHLHEGFGLRELDQFCNGLQRVWHRYSTGPLSWPGAALYYRVPDAHGVRNLPRVMAAGLGMMRILGSVPFRYIDFWNGAAVSCSVFAEYRKPAANG